MMIRDAQRNVGDKIASKQLAIILLTIVQINVEGDRGWRRVLRRMEPRATARWCESVESNNYFGFLVKYSCLSRYSSMMINELIVDIIPFVLNRARVFGQITLNGGINEDVVKSADNTHFGDIYLVPFVTHKSSISSNTTSLYYLKFINTTLTPVHNL